MTLPETSDTYPATLQCMAAFNIAETVHTFNPQGGAETALVAAQLFHTEVAALINARLHNHGLSNEQLENLTTEDVTRLAPDVIAQVDATYAQLGELGRAALSDQAGQILANFYKA